METAPVVASWLLGDEQASWLLGTALPNADAGNKDKDSVAMRRPDTKFEYSALSQRLSQDSAGAFFAGELARRRVPASTKNSDEDVVPGRLSLVAVVRDTTEVELQNLWEEFQHSQWRQRELVIVECYTHNPSSYLERIEASRDECIVIRLHTPTPLPLSVTQLIGAFMASGQYIKGCKTHKKANVEDLLAKRRSRADVLERVRAKVHGDSDSEPLMDVIDI